MNVQAIIAIICATLWAGLLYVAIRRTDWWSILVSLLAWLVNLLLGTGHIALGGSVRIISTGLVVLLLIDRLERDPTHVKRVSALQVLDARREMHAALNDRAAWEARAVAYRRMLDEHGITD